VERNEVQPRDQHRRRADQERRRRTGRTRAGLVSDVRPAEGEQQLERGDRCQHDRRR
jgi:hypothetical protein